MLPVAAAHQPQPAEERGKSTTLWQFAMVQAEPWRRNEPEKHGVLLAPAVARTGELLDMVSATSFPRLLAIGGAEDKEGERTILREFVRLAGGQGACIVVIPSASETPDVVGELYQQIFQQLGASEVAVLTIAARDDARNEAAMRQIERATGTFFTGGDQLRIMNRLGGTGVDTMLHRRCAEGMVVVGASFSDAVDTGPGGCITLSGVTLHSLPHGRSFDLLERRPNIAAD